MRGYRRHREKIKKVLQTTKRDRFYQHECIQCAFLLFVVFTFTQSHLFVLGVDYKRPGGGEEFEQAQQDRARVEATGYDQPAWEKKDDEANVSNMK